MVVVLLILAALLYFPLLRRAVGAYICGALFMVTMAILLGVPGVLFALAVSMVVFVRAFWRPARRRHGIRAYLVMLQTRGED
jgi:hypothetical protein